MLLPRNKTVTIFYSCESIVLSPAQASVSNKKTILFLCVRLCMVFLLLEIMTPLLLFPCFFALIGQIYGKFSNQTRDDCFRAKLLRCCRHSVKTIIIQTENCLHIKLLNRPCSYLAQFVEGIVFASNMAVKQQQMTRLYGRFRLACTELVWGPPCRHERVAR